MKSVNRFSPAHPDRWERGSVEGAQKNTRSGPRPIPPSSILWGIVRLEKGPKRAAKMIRGLEHLPYEAEGPLVVPFPQKECQGCCCYSGTIHRPAQSSPESEGGFGEAPFAEGLSIFLSSLVRVVHTDPIAEADCMKVEQQWRKIQILAEKDSQDMLVILQYFGYFWHNTEEEPQCFQQKFCKATMNLIEAASASRDGIAILTSIMLTVYKIGQVQPLGENVERCLLQKVLSSFAEVEADSPSECSQPVRKKAAEALQIVLRGWLREDSTTRHLRGLAKILDGWIHHLEHGWVRELCFSASSALLRYASTMPQIDMEWVRMTIAMPLFSNFQREKWRIHEDGLVIKNLEEEQQEEEEEEESAI